ncbi:sensor histidine kinase [Kitasatospora sp. NPDC059646]|uniref:sensor histidine kinase n=1 Tax=Kitasatospora sp. NPDC059646 TaxID=3346893 RepID=UPI003677D178
MRKSGAVLLPVAVAVAIGLGVVHLWWAPVAAGLAFGLGVREERVRPAAAVFAVLAGTAVLAAGVVPGWMVLGTRFTLVAVGAGLLPWLVGRYWHHSRELARAGWERAERLEREQRLTAEQARLRERARIARDMHDALGHDLSLIALRAGALTLAPDLAEPHRAAARDLRAGAAAAVERLGEVIGVLREDDDTAAGDADGPADAAVGDLLARAAAAGLDLRAQVTGTPDGLPRAVEHAVYRVVQEALTNATKHAPAAPVTATVDYTADGATVRIANGPAPAAPAPATGGGGHGLAGLHERVRAVGGQLSAAPTRDGGFDVTAHLPRTPRTPAGPPTVATTPAPTAPALRQARRRLRRSLSVALVVPLAAAMALTLAQRAWTLYVVHRSVLDPAAYAALQIGQDRAEVEPRLPAHRLPYRPDVPHAPAPPPGDDVRCDYYAVTAELFVDRYGDAYRLCYQAGRLVSRDLLAS